MYIRHFFTLLVSIVVSTSAMADCSSVGGYTLTDSATTISSERAATLVKNFQAMITLSRDSQSVPLSPNLVACFDLDANGSVNQGDLDKLLRDVLHTGYGDVNFDGVFNSSDLVQIYANDAGADQTFPITTWTEGDFNGDRTFDTSDLVYAFQNNQYE